MVEHVFDAVRNAGVSRIVCVIGHMADLMRERLAGHTDVQFALQTEQKGTGHAVLDEECIAMAERTAFPTIPDHIPVAVSRHPESIPPVSGAYEGGGSEPPTMEVEVVVQLTR